MLHRLHSRLRPKPRTHLTVSCFPKLPCRHYLQRVPATHLKKAGENGNTTTSFLGARHLQYTSASLAGTISTTPRHRSPASNRQHGSTSHSQVLYHISPASPAPCSFVPTSVWSLYFMSTRPGLIIPTGKWQVTRHVPHSVASTSHCFIVPSCIFHVVFSLPRLFWLLLSLSCGLKLSLFLFIQLFPFLPPSLSCSSMQSRILPHCP